MNRPQPKNRLKASYSIVQSQTSLLHNYSFSVDTNQVRLQEVAYPCCPRDTRLVSRCQSSAGQTTLMPTAHFITTLILSWLLNASPWLPAPQYPIIPITWIEGAHFDDCIAHDHTLPVENSHDRTFQGCWYFLPNAFLRALVKCPLDPIK